MFLYINVKNVCQKISDKEKDKRFGGFTKIQAGTGEMFLYKSVTPVCLQSVKFPEKCVFVFLCQLNAFDRAPCSHSFNAADIYTVSQFCKFLLNV